MNCYCHGTNNVAVGYREPHVSYFHAADDEDVFRRLSANHPRINGLIASYILFKYHSEWIEKLGRAISGSTHLRTLDMRYSPHYGIYDNEEEGDPMRFLPKFFMWLAHNRSIEHLCLREFDCSGLDIVPLLAPFIEHNINLRCIEIIGSDDDERSRLFERFPSALVPLPSKINRLERINLTNNDIQDECMTDIINALIGMRGLRNLLDLCLGENGIQTGGCNALRNLLTTPECNIQCLDLKHSYQFDDECMDILVDGLIRNNNTIQSLNVATLEDVTPSTAWIKFATYLSKPNCSLKRIWLGNDFDDVEDECSSLGESFAGIRTLQVLDLCSASAINSSGWFNLTKCLRVTSMISELYLDECYINDEGALVIFSSLTKRRNFLKVLSMASLETISAFGWVACFQLLLDSKSSIEQLTFASNNIDDEGASILVEWVATRTSLVRYLDLKRNRSISANGWIKFADVLNPSSTSKLERLQMGTLDEDVATSNLNALKRNTSLIRLEFDFVYPWSHPSSYWDAFTTALCDNSSIAGICNSNHTLYQFDFPGMMPDDLAYMLHFNKSKNKMAVVRLKLRWFYFSDIAKLGKFFYSLKKTILPHAIEWIGRDRNGFKAMYDLFRTMPWLINMRTESKHSTKKKRRVN